MINIGNRRECFFDKFLIDEEKSTVRPTVNKPVPQEIVFEYNMPWEFDQSYTHFFKDGDLYRMYYVAWNKDKYMAAKPGDLHRKVRLCYAESTDGINWVRPNLGIYEWEGSKDNNIIFMPEWDFDGFYVFKDENPDCPKDEKYKAVGRSEEGFLVALFSPDGIHFEYEPHFISDKGVFDTLNIIFWDKDAKVYKGYVRSFHNIPMDGGGDYLDFLAAEKEGGAKIKPGADTDPDLKNPRGAALLNLGIRDIRYIESKDFKTWTDPELIDFGEKPDIPLYTNHVTVYERAPHMFLGFPTRYHERYEWSKAFDVLCGKEQRLYKMKTFAKRMGLTVTDCVFMASRDSRHFTRYDEAIFRPGPEFPANWIYGNGYPARGYAITDGKIKGTDKEISVYCPEPTDAHTVLRRYTYRMDGFASIHSGEKEELLVTKPFIFEGSKLYANISTSACGFMVFELSDNEGNTVKSCEMFGDSIDKEIGFETDDISAFSGKEVVLKVRMIDSDLYSIKFE